MQPPEPEWAQTQAEKPPGRTQLQFLNSKQIKGCQFKPREGREDQDGECCSMGKRLPLPQRFVYVGQRVNKEQRGSFPQNVLNSVI